MFEEQRLLLQAGLQENAQPDRKAWWENYVKGSAPFLGVKMPVIRKLVHGWHKAHIDQRLDDRAQLDLALALFDGRYAEEKLAGTLFLQEILLPAGAITCEREIDRFASLFADGRIYDWNICDWFCMKVLGPLIQENRSPCADRIAAWRNAKNLWQARAALAPFVKVAGDHRYYPAIDATCHTLIHRPERFAKTAVGWILREISKHDEAFVRQVIERDIHHFSSESLKNGIKYFDRADREHYREMFKQA